VVVMDIRMPMLDGLAATAQIAGAGPRPGVLILTTFDLDEYVYEALGAGASGFLLKDASGAELVEAVRVVARGDALLAPSVTRRLISAFARRRHHERPASGAASGLTPRELDVLRLVARGLSNAEIAAELVVTETTVKTHVHHLLTKLGARDRVQLVVLAYEAGLAGPRPPS
jgi:DNA-binding NarL/FixJ family response regulator